MKNEISKKIKEKEDLLKSLENELRTKRFKIKNIENEIDNLKASSIRKAFFKLFSKMKKYVTTASNHIFDKNGTIIRVNICELNSFQKYTHFKFQLQYFHKNGSIYIREFSFEKKYSELDYRKLKIGFNDLKQSLKGLKAIKKNSVKLF
jgi:hypothetical protein